MRWWEWLFATVLTLILANEFRNIAVQLHNIAKVLNEKGR